MRVVAEETAAGTSRLFCASIYFVVACKDLREWVVVYIDRSALPALRTLPPPL